nr:hypothetical protein GCM10017745_49820 [Saccharothrix mutabilis subsp. capreolus]
MADGVAVAEQLLSALDEEDHAGTAVVVIADGASSFDVTDRVLPFHHPTYVIDVAPGPGPAPPGGRAAPATAAAH